MMKSVKEFEKGLREYINSKYEGAYIEFYVDARIGEITKFVCDEFSGDWKHDHLYIDNLVREYCKDNDVKITGSPVHFYTDDTGSDWGTAYHIFAVKLEED